MWHSGQWVKCFNRLEPAGDWREKESERSPQGKQGWESPGQTSLVGEEAPEGTAATLENKAEPAGSSGDSRTELCAVETEGLLKNHPTEG